MPPLNPHVNLLTASLWPQSSSHLTHPCFGLCGGSPQAGSQGHTYPTCPRQQVDPHQLSCDVHVEGTSLLQQQEGRVKQVLGEAHGCHGTIGAHVLWQRKAGGIHGQDDGLAQKEENSLWGWGEKEQAAGRPQGDERAPSQNPGPEMPPSPGCHVSCAHRECHSRPSLLSSPALLGIFQNTKDSRGNQPPALGWQGGTYVDIQGNVVLRDGGFIDHEVANLGLGTHRLQA